MRRFMRGVGSRRTRCPSGRRSAVRCSLCWRAAGSRWRSCWMAAWKGTDELEDRYGLHLLARVEPEGAAKKNLRGLDKLFAEKPQYNDGAYLSAALSATGISGLVLSGDLANAQIAQTMKTAARGGGIQGLRSLRRGRSGRCG